MPASTANTADSQDASQDLDGGAVQNMAELYKKNVKVRRRAKEDQLKQAHKDRFAELTRKAQALEESHDVQVKTLHLAKVQRLKELVARKAKIEKCINDMTDEMENAFDTAAEHLSAGLRKQQELMTSR